MINKSISKPTPRATATATSIGKNGASRELIVETTAFIAPPTTLVTVFFMLSFIFIRPFPSFVFANLAPTLCVAY